MSFTYKHGDRPLDGYTVLRGLGRGGFGEVYFAVSDGGREVALKIIQQNHDIELRGVRHCMNLKSPHLVSIFDVKRNDDGVPFVIMEYVAGPSLRDIVRQHPSGLGDDRATYMLREISQGLGYLHENGIVHRDLKPENIFYEDGYVKIGDYGLSKYISVSRQSGQTVSVGTVHYMAPEIGSGNYHRGIDIYALGVIYFELLTGRVPFDGDSMGEIIMKHLTAEPDLKGIRTNLHGPISKALAKTPDERYQRVEPLIDDLLSNDTVKSRVDALDAASFATCATVSTAPTNTPTTPEPVPAAPTAETIGEKPERKTGRPAGDDRPNAAGVPPPRPNRLPSDLPEGRRAAAEARSRFGEADLDARLVQAAATAAGMAVALSFFSGFRNGFDGIALSGCLVSILAGSAMVLAIEHWAVPRFNIDMGIAKRVMTLGLAGPALAFAVRLFPPLSGHLDSLPAIFASLLLINWTDRARANRNEPASLGLAFSAGLCGALATWVLKGTNGIFVGGLMASISLVVNAASPFVRKENRGGSTQRRPWIDQPAEPPPPPPRPPQPSAPAEEFGTGNVTAEENVTGHAPVSKLDISPEVMYRPRSDYLIAGVCAGIARRYGWEPVWTRLAFALGTLLSSGLLLPLYWICYLSMPEEIDLRRRLAAGERLGPLMRIKRLVRPDDRVVGGVCAGLAARYGWEVLWVRIVTATLIFLSVGYGLVPYVVLWMLMPSAATPSSAGARLRTNRRTSAILAVLFIGAGVFGFSIVAGEEIGLIHPGHLDEGESMTVLLASIASVGLGGFAIFRARLRDNLGWWIGTVGPLLLVASLTCAIFCGVLLTLQRDMRESDTAFVGVALASSALLSVILASQLLAASRHRKEGGARVVSAESQAGWSALGTLLVVAGFVIAVGVGVLVTPFGMRLVQETWQIEVPGTLLRKTQYGRHLIPAAVLFAPGMLCLLLARRTGGARHVVRGAVGWGVLAFLTGWLAIQLPASWYEFETVPQLRWANVGLAFLAGALLIAWPGRRPPETAEKV